MSLSVAKIILANAATNTAGAYFETTTVYTGANAIGSPGAATLGGTVPAGIWMLLPTNSTNVVIQMNTSTSLASPTFYNIAAVNVGATTFISDGSNVQLLSTNSANIAVTIYGTNGGQAVSGTYNNV